MLAGALTSWPVRAVRSLMLLAGIIAAPGAGFSAVPGRSCAGQAMGAHGGGHSSGSSITSHEHHGGCAHCPAAECALAPSCSGSSATALPQAAGGVADLDCHRLATIRLRHHPRSALSPPDTPPPQLTA
jgi:hypothetical protein